MEVHEESFCDHDEPDDDGFHSYWYEGTVWVFGFGDGRFVRGRRYADTPSQASLYFNPEGPTEGDAEVSAIVEWPHAQGVTEIDVLGGPNGYRPLQSSG